MGGGLPRGCSHCLGFRVYGIGMAWHLASLNSTSWSGMFFTRSFWHGADLHVQQGQASCATPMHASSQPSNLLLWALSSPLNLAPNPPACES